MPTIQLFVDEPTRRRLEESASRHRQDVPSYCLSVLQHQLLEDSLSFNGSGEMPLPRPLDNDLLGQIRRSRQRMLAQSGGAHLSLEVLELVRAERDEELLVSLY
ncbi:MAG: hypothetical protein KJZ86_00760 [Caldilineaceae bacterium]|nr:hypothetical protein [Caldilineaceae bacterium]HRJ42157.1 hypothetical protein [Caldilineaceae bacterium]